jgi:GDP-L-fucose synthase
MSMDLKHKRIVVTGGSGFLGTAVVRRLHAEGCSETLVPRSSQYDLRKPGDARRMLDELSPHIVIHAAGVVGGIAANASQPARFLHDNLLLGLNLLEAAQGRHIEKFVSISSVCAYPKNAPIPLREQDLWDGYPESTNAGYGLAKRVMIPAVQAYRDQYGIAAISLLPTNLYGPGCDFDPAHCHAMAAIIRKCVEAKEAGEPTITLWGDGTPTREFLFVDDAAEGIVLATRHYDDGEPVNLGCTQEISIAQLAAEIQQLTGYNGRIEWDASRPNGQPRRRVDATRAADRFGFRASTRWQVGLRATLDWYLEHRERLLAAEQEGLKWPAGKH